MKDTRLIMGMPITVLVEDTQVSRDDLEMVFDYFTSVDETFSTYKKTSEISKYNLRQIIENDFSPEVKEVLDLCEKTKRETHGYFDIQRNGKINPSGLVKGWSIYNAAKRLRDNGINNFFIDAGGDIQVSGRNWKIGIRNPFNRKENVKIIQLNKEGVATSGTAIRGQHIYNPYQPEQLLEEIVSLTVIGPNVYEADRMATAAFAMGREGLEFVENLPGFEAYMIDKDGMGSETSGFERYGI